MTEHTHQRQGNEAENDLVEQRMTGCANDVGVGQDHAIGETQALLLVLDHVAIQPDLQ